MKTTTKLMGLLLAFVMLCGVVPYHAAEVGASDAQGSDFTSSPKLAELLDEIFAGDINLYSDASCSNEVYFPLNSRLDNDYKYYIYSEAIGSTACGWQCWIYANAVYNKLFGAWVGDGSAVWYSENKITPGVNAISYDMFVDAGVKIGAYIRTTVNADGSFNSSYGHSLVLLSYDENGLTYLEGNGDGKGLVRMISRTWDEFNLYSLSGSGRRICHVYQPRDMYYEQWYPTDDVIKRTYPTNCLIRASADTSAMSKPCSKDTDPESEYLAAIKEGAELHADALILNSAGNHWYRITTSDGQTAYVPSSKMTFVEGDSSDITIDNIEVPNQMTAGNAFSLGGTLKSKKHTMTDIGIWVYRGTSSKLNVATCGVDVIDGKLYSIKGNAADMECMFETLEPGVYTLTIYVGYSGYYAVDEKTSDTYSSECTVLETVFTVVEDVACTHDSYSQTVVQEPSCIEEGIVMHTCDGCGESYTETLPTVGHDYSAWDCADASGSIMSGLWTRYCYDCGQQHYFDIDITELTNANNEIAYEASTNNPIGYTFLIEDIDGVITGEDATICTSQYAYESCNPNWAITIYAQRQDDGTYLVLRDAIVYPGSAANASLTFGDGRVAIVIHSASSDPQMAGEYPNWMDKIAAMAIKSGDVLGMNGMDPFTGDMTLGEVYVFYADRNEETIPLGNLALGATYETSPLYQASANTNWGWDDNASPMYPDENGSSLTDGFVYPTRDYWLYQDVVWCGFNAKAPDYQENGYSRITVDLGDVYDLERYTIWVATVGEGSDVGIYAPASVEFSVSTDGVNYDVLGTVVPIDPLTRPIVPVTLDVPSTARYVTVKFNAKRYWMFVSEIEVYNTECLHENIEMYYENATCIVSGREVAYCADCGQIVQEADETYAPHDYDLVWSEEADCVLDGYNQFTCTVCGDTLYETVPATGHDYLWMGWKDPDCTDGYDIYECQDCGYEYYEMIPATGHVMITEREEPTCEFAGYVTEVCCECGYVASYTELEKTAHLLECIDREAPTCQDDGYETRACVDCSYEETEILPATGHNYQNNVCTFCGDKLIVEYGVELHVSDVQATAGETVTVDVILDKNVGFTYLNLMFGYDADAMELVSVSNGTIVDSLTQGKSCIWSCADNATETGVLATLTFAVKEDAAAGDYAVTVRMLECCNEEELDVAVSVQNGAVTVVDFVYGDCTGDGEINGKDVTRLLRYLANLDVDTGLSSTEISRGADCTGDGIINGKDVTRLLRYLANLDPDTGESEIVLGK